MQLADYLRVTAGLPFVWGECDCCAWACAWIAIRRGVDPAGSYRGRYSSERGALKHLARGGGMVPLVRREMAVAGLAEVAEPKPGDVGLVETDSTLGVALAIRTAKGWAAKSPTGVVVSAFPCLVAWGV